MHSGHRADEGHVGLNAQRRTGLFSKAVWATVWGDMTGWYFRGNPFLLYQLLTAA